MPDVCLGAFLRLQGVKALTGLGKSFIYEAMNRPTDPFPKPFKLSNRAVVWSETEIRAWMASHPRATGAEAA